MRVELSVELAGPLRKTTGNVQWVRRLAGREYVNQISLETNEGSERIKAACGSNHERLVALNNIKPTVYGTCRKGGGPTGHLISGSDAPPSLPPCGHTERSDPEDTV